MDNAERYARQIDLFGEEGQARIRACRIGIVGLGGLGSHIAQQAAYLGVRDFVLIDDDQVSLSNLNRLIGATPADVAATEHKLAVACRQIEAIAPEASVDAVKGMLTSESSSALAKRSLVFGCVDHDLPRLTLTEICSGHAIPYIDLATDVGEDASWYGGRVIFMKGDRCLHCLNELDHEMINRAQMSDEMRAATDRIYGVDRSLLEATGPSVVNLNGVVAALGLTEFMVWVTGLRDPRLHLRYAAERGIVTLPEIPPRPPGGCYYCDKLWTAAAH
jgi:molybdopterin/thiamine biosynthesis adenylyltransferase